MRMSRIIMIEGWVERRRHKMLCIEKGRDRTKVLPSNALYPTCRASASNVVVTDRMLNEESKCSMFKKSRRCRHTTR
jgi:hypothetical protein